MCWIKFQIINILLKMRRISRSTTNHLEFLFLANLLPKPKTILDFFLVVIIVNLIIFNKKTFNEKKKDS